jgi:hypothetical protein
MYVCIEPVLPKFDWLDTVRTWLEAVFSAVYLR